MYTANAYLLCSLALSLPWGYELWSLESREPFSPAAVGAAVGVPNVGGLCVLLLTWTQATWVVCGAESSLGLGASGKGGCAPVTKGV